MTCTQASDFASIRPETVLALQKPADGFLCPLSANTYGLEFLAFSISDYDTKKVLFDVARDTPVRDRVDRTDKNASRKIKYQFSEDVLRLPRISTALVFSVGAREVHSFRMIERHYFRDKLIKSFDFNFGFCIPNSTNTWTATYCLPALEDALINSIVSHPYATSSDSFYFVQDRLIMHNKATYRYIAEDRAELKRSYDKEEVADDLKLLKDDGTGSVPLKMSVKRTSASREEVQSCKSAKPQMKWETKERWSKEDDYI